MSKLILSALAVLLCSLAPRPGDAQIPRVCVENATQVNSTCCPPNPDLPSAGPCGGAGRGRCALEEIVVNGSRTTPSGPLPEVDDLRADWPVHIFQYACKCNFFYSGYACQHSVGGESGSPWQIFIPWLRKNVTRVRKNALEMTAEEKQRFVDLLQRSKEELSDYVILNDTKVNAETGEKQLSYFNVSIYDFYVFLNYYATKGVDLTREDSSDDEETVAVEDGEEELPDFAHKNPQFIPFHRALLTRLEEDLDALARKLNLTGPLFAFPYWNWANQTTCEVCNDTLVGAIDENNKLSDASPFSKWRALCQGSVGAQHPCDPEAKRPLIERGYSEDPLYQTLPTMEEVSFVLNATQYDSAPYNEMSDATSFRNLLEGYIGPDNNGTAVTLGRRYMGMQVRNYLNGTWTDLALGPNDPIFWLHQAFLDHLYDMWQKKNKDSAGFDIPENATLKKGQSRQDNLVGFLPTIQGYRAKKFSTSMFGYSYAETTELPMAADVVDADDGTAEGSYKSVVWGILGATGMIICVGLFAYYRRQRFRYRYVESISFEEVETPCSETTRLLDQRSRQKRSAL